MNPIANFAKTFAGNLKSGKFYKAPLSEAEKQGHHLVAVLLEKAADSAEIMGSLACDFFNTLASNQTKAAADEAAKDVAKGAKQSKADQVKDKKVKADKPKAAPTVAKPAKK